MGADRHRLIAALASLALVGFGLGLGSVTAAAFQSTGDGSWVWQNPLPEGNNIQDISCPAAGTCVGVEGAGGIVRSTDSGASWTWTSSGAKILYGVACPATTTCYAVGANGAILKTTDGTSWTSQTSSTTELLHDINCPSTSVCFAVSILASIGTTDGGTTWHNLSGGAGNGVSCPTTSLCYSINYDGTFSRTSDGGATWTVQPVSTYEYFINISCPSTTSCFAVSGNGNVFHTADSGSTWQKQSGSHPFLYSVTCASTLICMAAGGSEILSTSDGGATWKTTSDKTWGLDTISCQSTTSCYAAGGGNLILRTTDGAITWSHLRPSGVTTTLTGVSCPAAGTCFSVGYAGTILTTANGGNTWSAQVSPYPDALFAVSCPDVNTCYAVGNGGTIIATKNGGSTWAFQTSGSSMPWNSISCPSATTCFAVAGPGIIRATTNGGTTWTAQTSNTSNYLNGIACTSTTSCHVVGSAGTMLVTANGGSTWSPQGSGTSTDNFSDISCPSLSSCYVLAGGTIWSTQNGGSTWSTRTIDGHPGLNAVGCRTDTTCFAVGFENASQLGLTTTIVATTDGSTWARQNPGSDVGLMSVVCPSSCWTVGQSGAILAGPVGIIDPSQSSAVANPPFVRANGTSTSAVTVTVKDTAGNPVAMKPVSLAKIAGPGAPNIAPATATTNSAGQAVFTVASSTVGRDTFQATQGTTAVATVDITFTGALRAVLPALANAAYGGYTTSVYAQNLGTTSATLAIEYFDQDGHVVGSGDVTSGLPARASWTVRQDTSHSYPAGGAGSALIFSDQPVATFVNEFAPGNSSDATSYTAIASPTGTASTLFAPAIASNAYGGYTTGIGLINLSAMPTDVTITYRDFAGSTAKTQTLTGVPAGAYRGVYSGDSGSATDAKLPADFAGTATITSGTGQPLAAVVNEVGPGGQFSSYDAVAAGNTTLQAPVALNNAFGGYYTGIGVQNTTATAGTVTLKYFDSAGAATTRVFPIAPHGYIGIYQGSLTDGPAAGAYTAQISSGVAIASIVNEVAPAGSGGAQRSTAYNTFAGGTASANLALVENAGSDGWSTALGIMNTGTAATSVTVTYYDAATGAPVGTAQTNATLQPNAFWPVYQPDAGLPAGQRATAVVTTSAGGTVAVICNETNAASFMSYDAQ